VVRIESRRRDPTRDSTPELFHRLNGAKATLSLDFDDPGDRAELRRQVQAADALITSARPRAFTGLGLEPQTVFAGGRSPVWIAITAHGWTGDGAYRVGFGDDAAAAGGLMGADAGGAPTFLGDALADPVTGLMAAAAGLRALARGGGVLLDMAMSRCAATAAASLITRSAA
jgi:crotonobetainyl-CoA:carnitine CoA-transferase CaiB-like acyl-CoA transferase